MQNESHYKEVLARLEGLKELITSKFEANEENHTRIIGRMDIANSRTSKCEERVGILENWRWYLIGISSVIIVVADYIFRK